MDFTLSPADSHLYSQWLAGDPGPVLSTEQYLRFQAKLTAETGARKPVPPVHYQLGQHWLRAAHVSAVSPLEHATCGLCFTVSLAGGQQLVYADRDAASARLNLLLALGWLAPPAQ